jgi:glycosyltransferase involved in cell wall biosynthesis
VKLVQINATCGAGSTGKICVSISEMLNAKGVDNYILYASGQSDYARGLRYMDHKEVKLQALRSRILGNYGFNSKAATRRLLAQLDRIAPDIVHLHNLHGHNCNLEMLFSYFKEKGIRLYWTFHDCWAFTGYCPYYDIVKCEKWKNQCENCPQRKASSWFFDRSQYLFEKKKALFTGLDLTIVVPSDWMAKQVKQSFLRNYEVKVIHNGIDLSVFCPTESDFRQRYGCQDKFIVLGVAFGWGARKGLDVLIELAKRLDERFQIVLVGTDDRVDRQLPQNIISIHRTGNQAELAAIYTAADLFVNPTREENYPTVNMEALACGTPVLTFRTGGSPEILDDSCGAVVDKDDLDGLEREILRIFEDRPYTRQACLERAREFDCHQRFEEYVKLYEEKNPVFD